MNDAAEMDSDIVLELGSARVVGDSPIGDDKLCIVQRAQAESKPIKPKHKKAYNDFTALKSSEGVDLRA